MKTLFPILLLALAVVPAAVADTPRPFGDTRVLAPVPTPPGFPESVTVHGNKVFVSTQAHFGTAGAGPSAVYAYDLRTGARVRDYVIQGEDLSQEHGLSQEAFDDDGRLYVTSTQLGVIRIDPISGAQEIYATAFPSFGPPSLPNSLAFDAAGNLYVTDSLQALIWRITPGAAPRTPQVWFSDSRLAVPFGPNGIRLSPDRSKVYFAVTGLGAPGAIYTLPLVDHPAPGDLQTFHVYPVEAPDEIVFGVSGKLYVSLAGTSQIAVLGPDGVEQTRISSPLFDAPAGLAFDPRTSALLVANHAAFSGDPSHMAVLNTYVGDQASPLEHPMLP
jgi:sugar lactone lactonase YvrE